MQTSEKQTKKIIKRTHRKILARAREREREREERQMEGEANRIKKYRSIPYARLDYATHTHSHTHTHSLLHSHSDLQRVCRHFDLAMGSGSSA